MALRRQNIAIKRNDGEPLTRADLQYDVLANIFNDTHIVFTDPYNHTRKLSFRDLYVNTILHSPKCSRSMREKMTELPNFATDVSMLCLLSNVGRINTTMSFFAEMKTNLRTYHPIPALQRTSGSLQDAPRLKAICKAALFDNEIKTSPSTPADVLSRANGGQIPPTSVANLIFVLTHHSHSVGQAHFSNEVEFVDLFLPNEYSSESRARAFLWLCYHYLESSSGDNEDEYDDFNSGNPFCDALRPGRPPQFVHLTPQELASENVDPDSEKQLGMRLVTERNRIVVAQGERENIKKAAEAEESVSSASDHKAKRKRGPSTAAFRAESADGQAETPHGNSHGPEPEARDRTQKELHVPPGFSAQDEAILRGLPDTLPNQYPVPPPSFPYQSPSRELRTDALLHRRRSSRTPSDLSSLQPHRYAPYTISPQDPKQGQQSYRTKGPRRTMLQHTWHVIMRSDPLLDYEELEDEHDRRDYLERLSVISRLRGKNPTPEPEGPLAGPHTLHRGPL